MDQFPFEFANANISSASPTKCFSTLSALLNFRSSCIFHRHRVISLLSAASASAFSLLLYETHITLQLMKTNNYSQCCAIKSSQLVKHEMVLIMKQSEKGNGFVTAVRTEPRCSSKVLSQRLFLHVSHTRFCLNVNFKKLKKGEM